MKKGKGLPFPYTNKNGGNMKKDIYLPDGVDTILEILNKVNKQAYVVGGAIRDCLISKPAKDWDIATDATVSEMKEIFKEYTLIETGIKYGTLTVRINGDNYEITTFRKDGKYSDSRRPDEVEFTNDLKEDLKRRDFTINALAYHPSTGLIDYFGGEADIHSKVIKTVGNPDERFSEDPLRILRAMRFSSKLGFIVDPKTFLSMNSNKEKLLKISKERIQSELNGILLGNHVKSNLMINKDILGIIIPYISTTFNFGQESYHHDYDVWTHTVEAINAFQGMSTFIPQEDCLIIKLALLLHDIGKPDVYNPNETGKGYFIGHEIVSSTKTVEILKELKYSLDIILTVSTLVFNHTQTFETKSSVKKFLRKHGEKIFSLLIFVRKCDILAHSSFSVNKHLYKMDKAKKFYEEILREKEIFALKDLALNGYDLLSIGLKGKEIGMILDKILEQVMDGKLKNEHDVLLEEAKKMAEV